MSGRLAKPVDRSNDGFVQADSLLQPELALGSRGAWQVAMRLGAVSSRRGQLDRRPGRADARDDPRKIENGYSGFRPDVIHARSIWTQG